MRKLDIVKNRDNRDTIGSRDYSVIDKPTQFDMLIYDFHFVVVGSGLEGENVDGIARRNQLVLPNNRDVKGEHVGSRCRLFGND